MTGWLAKRVKVNRQVHSHLCCCIRFACCGYYCLGPVRYSAATYRMQGSGEIASPGPVIVLDDSRSTQNSYLADSARVVEGRAATLAHRFETVAQGRFSFMRSTKMQLVSIVSLDSSLFLRFADSRSSDETVKAGIG